MLMSSELRLGRTGHRSNISCEATTLSKFQLDLLECVGEVVPGAPSCEQILE